MWVYQKTLQHPVNIKNMDLKMAKYLITQFGGPNGELAASLRYLSQRYTMPTGKTRALLTDIGTEELAHVEMIASMVYQLTARNHIMRIIRIDNNENQKKAQAKPSWGPLTSASGFIFLSMLIR